MKHPVFSTFWLRFQEALRLLGRRFEAKYMTRVSHLSPGAICGELAMLGITPTRSATILAGTLCIMWEVTQVRKSHV